MKFFKRVLAMLLVFICFSPIQIKADEAVVGEKYDVIMGVHKDGSIDVNVNYTVLFNTPSQGIYLTVPQSYTMEMKTESGEKTKKYFFPVSQIQSSTHELNVERSRKGVSIRMGTKGEYLSGYHTFNVSYKIQTTDLGLDGLQMFYMNMMPSENEFTIKELSYIIQFDQGLDQSYFIYPPGAEVIEKQLNGNPIQETHIQDFVPGETVTVEVPLPNDYFTFPIVDYTKPLFFSGVLVAVLVIVIYMLFGKDPIVVETVEFSAPDGINSAEVGYIYRGLSTTKDVISLIVYWASRGYLRIYEGEGTDDISLEKVKDLPEDGNVEERRLFMAIFKNEDRVELSSLKNTLPPTIAHVQMAIPQRFTRNPILRVYDRRSSLLKVLSIFLVSLIPAAMAYGVVLLKTSYPGDANVAFFVSYGIFFLISIAGAALLAFERVYKKNHRITYSVILIALISLIGFLIITLFGNGDNKMMVIATLLIYTIALFFAANTSRRTQMGANWVGQIRGLKRFIEVAEKDRLVALVNDTPYLFYDVLPYAYVLGISDVWIKKFEEIAIAQPDWYVSSNPNLTTYMMMNSLNRSLMSASNTFNSIEISSGSGGGSFSGGGGGGFSGGGFGGGGSGSW